MDIFLVVISVVIGFILHQLICGKYEGHRLNRSLRFSVLGYYVHIHHWFIYLVMLGSFYIYNLYHPILLGLLTGGIIQGLTYRDWYLFLYKKSRFEEIYAKWRPQ